MRYALILGLIVSGCSSSQKTESPAKEDDHIRVQHILIGFKGSVSGKAIARSQEEARTLARELLARARRGDDFDGLVKEFTDDSPPGIYGMANFNVNPGQGESQRRHMVAAFGDVGFKLKVGEFGLAEYDPKTSPYGFHVIKRVK